MTAVRIALTLRDGWFLKDGRGWGTSDSGRAGGLDWPLPNTLLGMIRSAVGRAVESRTGCLLVGSQWEQATSAVQLGAALALRREATQRAWEPRHRMWPVPADALFVEDAPHVQRLDPVAPKAVLRKDVADGLLFPEVPEKTKPRPGPRWWTEDEFVDWLMLKAVLNNVRASDLEARAMASRTQVHVKVDPETFTADEGMLFSVEVTEPLRAVGRNTYEWSIALESDVPDEDSDALSQSVFVVGGNGRSARAEPTTESLFALPSAMRSASWGSRVRLVVVTPALFEGGWLPDGFARRDDCIEGCLPSIGPVILRAAYVPRPQHASGWDVVKGTPRATERLVPAGAVYFVESLDGRPFEKKDVEGLWLMGIGGRTEHGFGRVVPGRW